MHLHQAVACIATLAAVEAISAHSIHLFDINLASVQGVITGVAHGGLTITGSFHYSLRNGIFLQSMPNGDLVNAGISGSAVSQTFGWVGVGTGQGSGGIVHGSYNREITPKYDVCTLVSGEFKFEGLDHACLLRNARIGNADVTFLSIGPGSDGDVGAFHQSNFKLDAQRNAREDVDYSVSVVPLPAVAWTGLATIVTVMIVRHIRRR